MEEFADNGLYLNHLRSISATSEAMHICACGTPVAMKDTAQGKGSERPRGRFLKSLQLAVKFQKKSDPQNLAQGFISLAEYTELRDHVLMQQDQIEDLLVAVETMARANGGDTEEGI
jgi:hypothetical protein